ncbi:MAG: hypothetical protein HUU35_01265 [Armatimonadetes bacterium]|nr:hypothetical protein [Armatimonadota bacterium]
MAWPLLVLPLVLATTEPNNLLSNPGFESTTDQGEFEHWRTLRGQARRAAGRQGGHSLELLDPSPTDSVLVESRHVPARPGGVYVLTGWLRTAADCSPGLYPQFHHENGRRLRESHAQAPRPTVWREVEVSATAPPEAATVSVAVYAYVGDVGTVWADDLRLQVRGGGEPGGFGIPRAAVGEKDTMEIGSRRELMVDDVLLESLSGSARRVLHRPVPANQALLPDAPWEGVTSAYFTVFRDGERVRLYYRGSGGQHPEVTCYAESPDGVTFSKPRLGLVELAGSKDNNVIWAGAGAHNFSPFLDTNPAAPAAERYKAVGGGPLLAFVSADGLRWRKLRDEPILTKGAFDSHNLAYFDSLRGEYVCYYRVFRDGLRDIVRSTSKDFLTWSEPAPLTYGDAPPEHLYTNNILPYERAPHLLLGLPARFVPERKKVAAHPEMGVSDALLMSSRDGLTFQRWPEAFIRPGLDPRAWTDRTNYPAWGMIQTAPGELSVYWTDHYRHPSFALRRGTIRLDGFASVQADATGGQMLTRPLVFSGRKLWLNYATSAAGSLRLELCNAAGEPLPGFGLAEFEPLYGDELEGEARWPHGDLAALAGVPVRLRVQLRDADLYAFRFGD